MKAIIGVVVMTQSAKLLFLYRDPGKACTVVLNRRTCCVKSHKVPSTNTPGLKYGDNKDHYINV